MLPQVRRKPKRPRHTGANEHGAPVALRRSLRFAALEEPLEVVALSVRAPSSALAEDLRSAVL
jgi:hypothetical protein